MAAESETGLIGIEIAHARPEKQVLLTLDVSRGTTIAEAIDLSGIRDKFPDLQIDPKGVGIFSRKERLEYVLKQGDRIEIYRPLIADPKEVRRERAKKG